MNTKDNVGVTFVQASHSPREVSMLIKSALETATGHSWSIDVKYNPTCTVVNFDKIDLNKTAETK